MTKEYDEAKRPRATVLLVGVMPITATPLVADVTTLAEIAAITVGEDKPTRNMALPRNTEVPRAVFVFKSVADASELEVEVMPVEELNEQRLVIEQAPFRIFI